MTLDIQYQQYKTLLKLFFVSIILANLTACASSSLFSPYPSQALQFKKSIVDKTEEDAVASLAKKLQSADGLLYSQEAMRLQQYGQNIESSKQIADGAKLAYRHFDDKAKISASGLVSQGASLFSNDNAMPYQGQAYERVLLNLFQAYNYLSLGDLEGASVELRQASDEQRQLELKYAKDSEEIKSQAQGEKIDQSSWYDSQQLSAMRQATSGVDSSFLNAYVYFVSALIWEAQGDWNAALVDYKKALSLKPNNQLLKKAVTRADRGVADKSAKLFVVYEQGFVAAKHSFQLSRFCQNI